jgi:hypothetical protein
MLTRGSDKIFPGVCVCVCVCVCVLKIINTHAYTKTKNVKALPKLE